MSYALRIHDLDLPGRDVALRRVSLEVPFGAAVGIVGRAGMGKSLLLRMLSGQRPAHGEVLEVLGLDLRREPRRVWESVGYVRGGMDSLLDWRSAAGNLHLEARQKSLPAGRIDAAVRFQLERQGLLQRATTRVARLDREARFRVGLAAAVVAQPRLVFLDEPLRGADAETAMHLVGVLEQWRSEDSSHTLLVAGETLDAFQGLLTQALRLDERGLVRSSLGRSE